MTRRASSRSSRRDAVSAGVGASAALIFGRAVFGGLTLGVLTVTALKMALGINDSAWFAVGGILIGWAVAWPIARGIPRTA